jgi:hypothetical protein
VQGTWMFFIDSLSCLWTENTATVWFADKNVASDRGKVANALNQGVISV